MLCQTCQKNNATIHFTKIVNGSVEEMHLCDSCAKKNNDLDFDFDFPFSFQKIFTGLIGSIQEGKEEVKNIVCSECGLTYKKFMEIGRFGCANCYETFREDVDSLLKGIHGHNEHIGKVPTKASDRAIQKKAMESLKIQLEESIVKEDFERAAFLRDEIKKLKSKTDSYEG